MQPTNRFPSTQTYLANGTGVVACTFTQERKGNVKLGFKILGKQNFIPRPPASGTSIEFEVETSPDGSAWTSAGTVSALVPLAEDGLTFTGDLYWRVKATGYGEFELTVLASETLGIDFWK